MQRRKILLQVNGAEGIFLADEQGIVFVDRIGQIRHIRIKSA